MHPKRVPQQVQVEVDPLAGATPLGSMQYAFLFRGCSLRSYPRLLSEDRVVSLVVSLRIIINLMSVSPERGLLDTKALSRG